jgi:hypothetical protein
MRQTRAATIAARLKSSLPLGEGEPSRKDKAAEFVAEGYSGSRIQAFSAQQKRFIEFSRAMATAGWWLESMPCVLGLCTCTRRPL